MPRLVNVVTKFLASLAGVLAMHFSITNASVVEVFLTWINCAETFYTPVRSAGCSVLVSKLAITHCIHLGSTEVSISFIELVPQLPFALWNPSNATLVLG